MSTSSAPECVPLTPTEIEIKGVHPAAEMYGLDTASEKFKALEADIAAYGQREPILGTPSGLIIDGRHRLRACEGLGITPKIEVFEGDDDDIYNLVISKNSHRRDLNEAQQAAAATKFANYKQGYTKSDGDNDLTQTEAGKRFGISDRSVRAGVAIRKVGADDVLDLMRDGLVSIATAKKLAELPEAKRRALGEEVRAGNKDVGKRIAAAYDEATEQDREKARAARMERLAKTAARNGKVLNDAPVDPEVLPSAWEMLLAPLAKIDEVSRAHPLSEAQRLKVLAMITAADAAFRKAAEDKTEEAA